MENVPHDYIEKSFFPAKGKMLFIAIIIIAAGSIIGIFYILKHTPVTQSIRSSMGIVTPTATLTPTPIPFYELTIPYLKNRTYISELADLRQISSNDAYDTYLASYESDGLRINGLLTKPKGTAPKDGWPAIVFVHGYIPPSQYQTNGQAYSSYVDYLARNGFVVFKIDLRGHGDSQGEAGGAYYSSDYIIDTLNAYAALENADFVNKKQIGLWGHSMAGNVTMRSITVKPAIPVLVIWAGAVYSYEDQRKYGIKDNSYQPPQENTQRRRKRQEILDTHGEPSLQKIFWQQMAPINFLDDVKGAMQIHHAVDDSVVDIGYSRDLIALLDKTSIRHEFYEYSSGGHNISGTSFTQAMDRTVDFFKKYLQK